MFRFHIHSCIKPYQEEGYSFGVTSKLDKFQTGVYHQINTQIYTLTAADTSFNKILFLYFLPNEKPVYWSGQKNKGC